MRYKHLIGALLLATSLLLSSTEAIATIWTDHYDVSNGYSNAGEGISTITFDDWECTGPGGRNAKDFEMINEFGTVGQKMHMLTLWPDRLTPDRPDTILHDITNNPIYTHANMDSQVNFYYWGYTSPGFDVPTDFTAYREADYSASIRQGSLFNNMLADLDGDLLVGKKDMHFNYYDVFSYVDATGVNPSEDVETTLSFQPYPVSDAIGWCGAVSASHPNALEPMAGQLTFDFAFDVYNGPNRDFMGTQIVPKFEMRNFGTLTVNVWQGADLQTFSSNAVGLNTNPNNTDRWDLDPDYHNRVSFHGGGVLPDGVWVSENSFNPDGSRKLNPDGTWNVTVVPEGTGGAVWHSNAFAGYAFILRADGYRSLDWFDEAVYDPDPCTIINCDDGNACTADRCVGGYCFHENTACNDSNFCTSDTCNAATGACVYTPVPGCLCTGQPDGTSCNDGNPCTLNDMCSGQVCAGTAKNCDDGNVCTTDSCDTATGNCASAWNTLTCDDGNDCTTGDFCYYGICAGKARNCNDGNICTTDSCDAVTGICAHTPNTSSCNDGKDCTTQDVCSGGVCAGTAIPGGCDPVTLNNNFTMLDPTGALSGGTNDVNFTWDGTKKSSVAASGQASNATLESTCPFFGITWMAHDVAIYGPGTYTVYADCPAGSPGCGAGAPITFAVGAGELGAHMLFNWGGNNDIDVVNVWSPKASFGPSPLQTAGCGSNPADKVWDWMSKDWDGDILGLNGYGMVDGPFIGFNANFNVMGVPPVPVCPASCDDGIDCTEDSCDVATGACVHTPLGSCCTSAADCNDNNICTTDACGHTAVANCCVTAADCEDNNVCSTDTCVAAKCVHTPICPVLTTGNNFTMIDPTGKTIGGSNDVIFSWDGSKKTSVAASGQISNTVLSSTCPFQGIKWLAHDVAIYGPGSYTVYAGCAPGSPGCGTGTAINFTVGAGQLGAHMLFDWGASKNIDVVDVWNANAAFAPSALWATACGSNPAAKVWDLMSSDWNGDGKNGYPMVDGPFLNFNASFNMMGVPPADCVPANCDDGDACTDDSCNAGACAHTPINCNDNNVCTTDSCNPASGCVNTTISCNDNNDCTADSCDPATGCVHATVADGTTCSSNGQNGVCTAGICEIAPCNGVKSVIIRGGGQKPGTVDLQIQTEFTVVGDGCIVDSTPSTVTVSAGTILQFNCKAGIGPHPTAGTWQGAAFTTDSSHTIVCPAASGDVGKLIIDNKAAGGKDADRMTVTVQ
ncbi:MAG: hypothetical protein M0R70_14215 [Nitrospirae bacterium]|nr:hypothetical protein [Nitrospirota bacterium]